MIYRAACYRDEVHTSIQHCLRLWPSLLNFKVAILIWSAWKSQAGPLATSISLSFILSSKQPLVNDWFVRKSYYISVLLVRSPVLKGGQFYRTSRRYKLISSRFEGASSSGKSMVNLSRQLIRLTLIIK